MTQPVCHSIVTSMRRPRQPNLKRLRALMQKYELKGDDVAKRLGVTTRRVYGWLSVGQTTPIPTTKLQLLELLLRSQASQLVPLHSVAPPPKKKRAKRTKKKPKKGKLK